MSRIPWSTLLAAVGLGAVVVFLLTHDPAPEARWQPPTRLADEPAEGPVQLAAGSTTTTVTAVWQAGAAAPGAIMAAVGLGSPAPIAPPGRVSELAVGGDHAGLVVAAAWRGKAGRRAPVFLSGSVAGQPFTPPVAIAADGEPGLRVATDENRRTTVVWRSADALMAARFTELQPELEPRALIDPEPAGLRLGTLLSGDQDALLSWSADGEGFVGSLDADFEFAPPVRLGPVKDEPPVLALIASGAAVVAWTAPDGTVTARSRPAGVAEFDPPVRLAAGSAPQAAIDREGVGMVAWRAGTGVAVATLVPEREPVIEQVLPDATTAPRVAVDWQGMATLTAGTPRGVEAITRTRRDASWSAPTVLGPAGGDVTLIGIVAGTAAAAFGADGVTVRRRRLPGPAAGAPLVPKLSILDQLKAPFSRR